MNILKKMSEKNLEIFRLVSDGFWCYVSFQLESVEDDLVFRWGLATLEL